MEGRTVRRGELAHVMETLGAGAGGDVDAAAFEQPAAGRPQSLQADVLVQAHAAHLADGAAERSDRDTKLTGEISRIDRSGRIGSDVIVDQLHELGRPPA